MDLEIIKHKINSALNELYNKDQFLFDRKLCERCINHRFALYLEMQNFTGYIVDCEYNKSHINIDSNNQKRVSNPNGNYIDIIITKRDGNYQNDLICFEVKRWDNYKGRDKDRENLRILTGGVRFEYDYGFYIIFGKNRDKTKVEIYKNGTIYQNN